MARTPIHPGVILADEIATLELNASKVAKALGVPVNRITQILRGSRNITADTALRLARWLGTTPQFWLNLQQSYDLRMAELQVGKAINHTVKALPHSAHSQL